MGLKITSVIDTDKGSSNEVYVMINNFQIDKSPIRCETLLSVYKSQADREKNIGNTCQTVKVKSAYRYKLESMNISIVDMYDLIKEELIKSGLEVETV
jgi:hypothetical protein